MKGAQKYEPAIWERGVEGGGGVAFALSQFRGLDYLGTWNSRYSESVFLSEEVKKKNGVKSFDVTEVRTSGLFNLVLCRQAGHGFLSASIRLLIKR